MYILVDNRLGRREVIVVDVLKSGAKTRQQCSCVSRYESHAVSFSVLGRRSRIVGAFVRFWPATDGHCEAFTKWRHEDEVGERVYEGVTHCEEHAYLLHRCSKLVARHSGVAQRVRPSVKPDRHHEDGRDDYGCFCYRRLNRLQCLRRSAMRKLSAVAKRRDDSAVEEHECDRREEIQAEQAHDRVAVEQVSAELSVDEILADAVAVFEAHLYVRRKQYDDASDVHARDDHPNGGALEGAVLERVAHGDVSFDGDRDQIPHGHVDGGPVGALAVPEVADGLIEVVVTRLP